MKFRSCQKIVNVACKLQNITENIKGHGQDLYGDNSAIYYEYENVHNAIQFFTELLQRYKTNMQKAIVLTRSSNLKNLLTGVSLDYAEHFIIKAIQLNLTIIFIQH